MQLEGNFKSSYSQQMNLWGVGRRNEEADIELDIVFSTKVEAETYVAKSKQAIKDNGWHVDPPFIVPVVPVAK